MKIKPQKLKMSIDGENSEHGKLTKKAPRIVWYAEHSSITASLSKGKNQEQAKAEYLARAVRAILQAALELLDKLYISDQSAAEAIAADFFLDVPATAACNEENQAEEIYAAY